MAVPLLPTPVVATLSEYVQAHLRTPFEWGRHDCVIFAARWAAIQTGRELFKEVGLTEDWHDEVSAARAVKSVGGLERALDRLFTRTTNTFARDGDVALIDRTVYLYFGEYIIGPGLDGLAFVDRMEAQCAWAVV